MSTRDQLVSEATILEEDMAQSSQPLEMALFTTSTDRPVGSGTRRAVVSPDFVVWQLEQAFVTTRSPLQLRLTSNIPLFLKQILCPLQLFCSTNMSQYWRYHKFEIIAWVVLGVLLIASLAWCCCPKPQPHVQPATPVLGPRRYPNDHDVELAPLPRAFVPVPLYENHERDIRIPDYTNLDKRADGYHYPRHLEEIRVAGRGGSQS